jgi:outer membrane protein OmpA-like peptidoglycan-associated protein
MRNNRCALIGLLFTSYSISNTRLRNIVIIRILLSCFLLSSFLNSVGQLPISYTVYFRSNSSALTFHSKDILSQVIKKCKSSPPSLIKIFAYADTLGSETFNEKLSKNRANVVYRFLAAQPIIDTSKIYLTWRGESEDGYDLHFDEAHLQKRCVDILLYLKKGAQVESY